MPQSLESQSPERRPLRRSEASHYLKEKFGIDRKPSTLAKLAVVGGSPPFRHAGRFPLYAPDDLDSWARSIISEKKNTTSDKGNTDS
jgi:hypothetical protein